MKICGLWALVAGSRQERERVWQAGWKGREIGLAASGNRKTSQPNIEPLQAFALND